MKIAPLPLREKERVERLRALGILDTAPEAAFDAVTALAARICDTPIALISLIDTDRQWFKSRLGLAATETARDFALCAHAILAPGQVMEVPDAQRDERFRDNPLVTGEPNIRYYAGAPIVTHDGLPLGTVCVIDHVERTLDERQLDTLRQLAALVRHMLEHTNAVLDAFSDQADTWRTQQAILRVVGAEGTDLKAFIDRGYRYRYATGGYLDYWGLSESELIGRAVPEVLTPDTFLDTLKPHLDQALAGHEARFQTVIDFARAGTRHVQVSYTPALPDARGLPTGVVARIQDIHELKARELQLETTVKLLEHRTLQLQQFIHVLSHDLKEPLNTIGNFVHLLDQGHRQELGAPGQRYLDNVITGSGRMKRLVDDLRRFMEVEHHTMDMDTVDMDAVVREAQQDLQELIHRQGACVQAERLPPVFGNASLLRICFQNLLSNAIRFARPGEPPRVRVHSSAPDNRLAIHVDDNGLGIEKGLQQIIFAPYTRLHTRRFSEGAGLGLAMCQRIASMHRGDIQVESTVGVGSRFSLLLPRRAPAPLGEAA